MKTTITAIIAAVVTSALLYLFAPTRPAQPSPTVYSKVQASKTIRAAYLVGAPLFMVHPNTKEKSRTFYEIVENVAANLGFKVDRTEEVAFADAEADAHRDVMVGDGRWCGSAVIGSSIHIFREEDKASNHSFVALRK